MVFGTGISSLAGVSVDIGVSENRTLATVQAPTPTNLLDRNYFSSLNSWASDHQALRAPFVTLLSATKLYAFNAPLNDKTLIGRDGFYFYGLRSMRRDYERLDRFENNPTYVREVLSFLRGLEAWSAQTGRRVLVMVAPNKHNVYPDKYNPSYTHGAGPGTGETLEEWLAKAIPAMAVPVGDALRSAARDNLIYYRTDTHWNPLGAKIAADQVRERLRTVSPVLPIASPAGEWLDKPEIMDTGNFADLLSLPIEETVTRPEPAGGFKAADDVSMREKLAELLPGRTRLFEVKHNPSAPGAPKLLMLGDSFMTALVPYLAEQFSASVFYNPFGGPNTPDERFPQNLIEVVDPDVVLVELVERRVRPCSAKKNRAKKCADMLTGDVARNILDLRLERLAREGTIIAENVAPQVSGSNWLVVPSASIKAGQQLMLRARAKTDMTGFKLSTKSAPKELVAAYRDLDLGAGRREVLFLARINVETGAVVINVPQTLNSANVTFDILSVPDDTNPEAITGGSAKARQISSHVN
jgi:hypothetical protein